MEIHNLHNDPQYYTVCYRRFAASTFSYSAALAGLLTLTQFFCQFWYPATGMYLEPLDRPPD